MHRRWHDNKHLKDDSTEPLRARKGADIDSAGVITPLPRVVWKLFDALHKINNVSGGQYDATVLALCSQMKDDSRSGFDFGAKFL